MVSLLLRLFRCLGLIVMFQALTESAADEQMVMKIGGTIVISCHSDGEMITWYGPNGNIIESDGQKFIIDEFNANLTVSKAGEFDFGIYRCQSRFQNETTEVFSPPYVKPLEKSRNLVQGDKLELVCSAFGNPNPRLQWLKKWNGEMTQLEMTDRISIGEGVGKLENTTLNITDVNYGDYGFYVCTARNEYGMAESNEIKIRVKDKLAPLWPFIGICIEVIILVVIIIVYEKRRAKQNLEEDAKEEGAPKLENSNDHNKDEENVRLRK